MIDPDLIRIQHCCWDCDVRWTGGLTCWGCGKEIPFPEIGDTWQNGSGKQVLVEDLDITTKTAYISYAIVKDDREEFIGDKFSRMSLSSFLKHYRRVEIVSEVPA